MTLKFAASDTPSLPLFVVSKERLKSWRADQPDTTNAWLDSTGFTANLGQTTILPGADGSANGAVFGSGDKSDHARHRFVLAMAQAKLPNGTFHLSGDLDDLDLEEQALGWLLSQYRFDKYAKTKGAGAALIAPKGIDAKRIEAMAAGEELTRDLINTPTSDMGPDRLHAICNKLAAQHRAKISAIVGDELLDQNFPMIHTVGRASATLPRLIQMNWGKSGPKLTLVGKGVCFDTGGLNLKPGASMGLMKKDMGGAATVLGLAHMIMALKLPIQLCVLIPAVENSVSANAFRPGDILTSRKGLTVEINNTDAEGRLVLADALALADETPPDLVISMATLTGAARVAVGPDLAPFYATDPNMAQSIRNGALAGADPVWEMPFHTPYEPMIEPGIADLDNAPKGGFGGSITAALFLRRFVEATPYLHFDIYGWQPSGAPARPKGGAGQGARAILNALPEILGL